MSDSKREGPQEYRLPVDLLQAVVNYLNARPCIEVRGLVNAIEAAAVQQDLEHQAAQRKTSRRRRAD